MSDTDTVQELVLSAITIGDGYTIGAARIGSSMPTAYRLGKKQSGEIVLQGRFDWTEGWEHGFDWEDLPTETLEY